MRKRRETETWDGRWTLWALAVLLLVAVLEAALAHEGRRHVHPGDTYVYIYGCRTKAAVVAQMASTSVPVEGCYAVRRPWPLRLLERVSGPHDIGGTQVEIWHGRDIPEPHEDVWLLIEVEHPDPTAARMSGA